MIGSSHLTHVLAAIQARQVHQAVWLRMSIILNHDKSLLLPPLSNHYPWLTLVNYHEPSYTEQPGCSTGSVTSEPRRASYLSTHKLTTPHSKKLTQFEWLRALDEFDSASEIPKKDGNSIGFHRFPLIGFHLSALTSQFGVELNLVGGNPSQRH